MCYKTKALVPTFFVLCIALVIKEILKQKFTKSFTCLLQSFRVILLVIYMARQALFSTHQNTVMTHRATYMSHYLNMPELRWTLVPRELDQSVYCIAETCCTTSKTPLQLYTYL